MKILFITMTLAICFIITVYKVDNIKKHTLAVRQCVMMIDNIEILLNHTNITVEKIIDSLLLSDNYYLLSFLKEIHISLLNSDFDNGIITKNNCIFFDKEDLTFINGFFSNFGKSDVYGQISNCKLYKEFLKTKLSKLENEEKNNCKSTSVMIMGIGFAVLMIMV